MEEGEEGPEQQPGSSTNSRRQVPPIATTPPYPGWKEEPLSQSSSGTQISSASGFSLGEVIRRRSAINQEMEAWYQPQAEIDTSNLIGAIGQRLGQAREASCDLAEFPVMEEGTLTPTEYSNMQHTANMMQTPLFAIQGSHLSPNLPLLPADSTQGRTFFNETLFQQTGMDFAPLRGIPDASAFVAEKSSSKPLRMSEAMQLAATEISSECLSVGYSLPRHPLALSTMASSHASFTGSLSQHPLSLSGCIPVEQRRDGEEQAPCLDVGAKALVSQDGSFGALGTQEALSPQLAAPLSPKAPQGLLLGRDDPFHLDSKVPAPLLLEMLETEVGLSKYYRFLSSSSSSSCKSVLGKAEEENGTSQRVVPQQGRRTVPEVGASRLLSDSEGKPFLSVHSSEQLAGKALRALVVSKGRSPGGGDSASVAASLPLSPLQVSVSEAASLGEKETLASATADIRVVAAAAAACLQPVMTGAKFGGVCGEKANTVTGIPSRTSKNESTLSGFSIESEHKEAGISPSFNEGSFLGHLTHPVHHSTPGVYTTRSLKHEVSGSTFPIKPAFQSPLPRLKEEVPKSPYSGTCVPSVEEPRIPPADETLIPSVEEPRTLKSGQEGKNENSKDLAALHPLKGRIQSLPSLNFMEKVGAWNVSQSMEGMSDALVLHGLGGPSPRQKAYSAIADSLNHILLKQKSQVDLQEGLAASFCGLSSIAGLSSCHKKSPLALPLTRSQSENNVVAVEREISMTLASHETNQDDVFQPAEGKTSISDPSGMKTWEASVEDPVNPPYPAVLVSTVFSDEDEDEDTTESADKGTASHVDHFITSTRVAELLREEACSSSGGVQEPTEGCHAATLDLWSSKVCMNIRDVSPNRLTQIANSGADLRVSSSASGQLQSGLEDACPTRSPILKTPDDREINIEERIPVYLRNLGIDQSPSSILTPFIPRGPIREIEFSPSELRTSKASHDVLLQPLQSSEEDPCSVIDVTLSSFNSSAWSVPAVLESSVAPDTPLPTVLSPQPSRDLLSRCSVASSPLEQHIMTLHCPEIVSECLAVPGLVGERPAVPAVSPSFHADEEVSIKCFQTLMNRSESKGLDVGVRKMSASSLSHEKDGLEAGKETRSSGAVMPVVERNGSFIGSQTLKEIKKRLSEAETRPPSWLNPTSSADLTCSFAQMEKMKSSEESGSARGSRPALQRRRSWDETLSRRSLAESNMLPKPLSCSGSLKWEHSLSTYLASNGRGTEETQPAPQVVGEECGTPKPVKRSEPEGCNSAAVVPNLPVPVKSATESKLDALEELPSASTVEALDNLSDVWGNFRKVLEETGDTGHKGVGSSQGSELSSSVDSLGLKVKHLLRNDRPTMPATWSAEAEGNEAQAMKQTPVEGHGASRKEDTRVSVSDHGSSLDSLAARVKTLLEHEQPVLHASRILQNAEEEEKRARAAWMKRKPTESPVSVPDLTAEDRQVIEKIKADLFLSARKAELMMDPLGGNGTATISSHSLVEKLDIEHSNVPGDNELQTKAQSQIFHLAGCPETSAGRVSPVCATDGALPRDPEREFLNTSQSCTFNQLQPLSEDSLGFNKESHPPVYDDTGPLQTGPIDSSKAFLGEEASVSTQATLAASNSPTEAVKQITSITFASRKRSPSPTSPVLRTGLTKPIPCGLVTVEVKSFSTKQLASSQQQLDTLNPTAPLAPDKGVGFSSCRDLHPYVSMDGSQHEKGAASVVRPQTICPEQKDHSATNNYEEIKVSSSVSMTRHDKILTDAYDTLNLERKMTNWALSATPCEQQVDSVSLHDQTPQQLSLKGKESMPTTEDAPILDSYSCTWGDADKGSSGLLPSSSSPDYGLTTTPGSPSSATRKALSGVHITLSPKNIHLEVLRPLGAATELGRDDGPRAGPQPTTPSSQSPFIEPASKLRLTEPFPKPQESAYFPPRQAPPTESHFRHSHVPGAATLAPFSGQELQGSRQSIADTGGQSREENLKATVSSQTERLSSDAVTQITTESPKKTTYSAEIFVSTENGETGTPRSAHWKSRELPNRAAPIVSKVSTLSRQTGKPPVLLPYKPPGSSEMYYVPCPKETLRLSRVRSETTVESSHSGSNDAVPPEFPAQALGSRDDGPPDAVAIKHREGIYSKSVAPKVAWTEELMGKPEAVKESFTIRSPLEKVKSTHSVFRPAQFYLHPPVPLQHEIDFIAGSEPVEADGLARPRETFQYQGVTKPSTASAFLHLPAGADRFSPLNAELDYSFVEELRLKEAIGRASPSKTIPQQDHRVAQEVLLPSNKVMKNVNEKQAADLPVMRSVHFAGSLDDLWAKYVEHQHQHRPSKSRGREMTLVERLDRLARLLQNPVRHTLMPEKDKQSRVQEEANGEKPTEIRSQEKRAYKSDLRPSRPVGRDEDNPDAGSNTRLAKSRQRKTGHAKASGHVNRNSEPHLSSVTLSDTSSEARSVQGSSMLTDVSPSESDATAQMEMETATQTEASSSISTIDTARLIRAFGHNRVRASPKLSQLYTAISLQKTRSEKWPKGSRKALGADDPQMGEHKRNEAEAAGFVTPSESLSTTSSSRGPSSALTNKRSVRMLNKAVQAGDFEIVNSATKKHTRDVGLTFPTPTSSQAALQGYAENRTEDELPQKLKRPQSCFLAEKRTRRNPQPQWLQGVSWFVPALDLKSKPCQREQGSFVPDPGPSWFEQLTNTKSWREPLREKNWQELAPGGLQESLALHRPDFISRSGERVKRLKLIMEERKLQNVLQSEREKLFNPPADRNAYRNARCLLPNRDYRALRRSRAISKSEMVQRSKRIYEQLPEVRKRREEEKRKSDYSSNRLKAQLYKAKITNRILGRKVPWE